MMVSGRGAIMIFFCFGGASFCLFLRGGGKLLVCTFDF